MKLTSSAFLSNQKIPVQYTCDGEDVNPQLSISGVPENTKTLAIIVDDLDATRGDWVHWLVFNISPSITAIVENSLPTGATEGMTDFGKAGWGGPCPSSGNHRYQFKVYALDTELALDSRAVKADLEREMKEHILDQAMLMGTYER